MAEERDPTDTVPLMLRIREDLRQDLEQSAKTRRISINQEVIDRLTYVRDRKGLLAEVLRLSFGERLGGLLLALGLAMSGIASQRGRRARRPSDGDIEWIDDPIIFTEAVKAAIMLLEAARPKGGDVEDVGGGRNRLLGRARARQVMAAVSGNAKPVSALLPTLPAREVEAIKELLGPVAQRMTPALHVRDALAARIASGEWKPNAAIPTEDNIAREFGVKSETVSKALDLMEHEGLLTRRTIEDENDKSKAKRDE